MTPRTKWLLLAGLMVLGLYLGDSVYRGWIEEPNQRLNSQLDAVTKKIRESKDEQLVAQKIVKRLDAYASRALPYNPQLARSLYQEWLLNLVETHAISAAAVDAAQPVAVDVRSRTKKGKRQTIGHRIAYTLRGQATLAKLTDFLYDFRQAGHLQKIRSLALNPIGSEGELDISLSIEVLSLVSSPSQDQLSDWWALDGANPARSAYAELVSRNLFARGFSKALFDIELKAITTNRDGQSEAWFSIDSRGTIQTLTAGRQVAAALHDISVVEVLPDRVLVHVNQDPVWIKLGQSIGEACSISPNS
jgi:hypothetical protein